MPITINGSGTVTGISAGGLPDGVITTDDIAASAVTSAKLAAGAGGKILQVVSTTKTDMFSSTSSTFTDITGLSATITPSSSSNKILVLINIQFSASSWSGGAGLLKLLRGSTDIAIGTGASNINATAILNLYSNGDVNTSYNTTQMAISYLDSPSATSSTTYKLQGKIENSGYTWSVNRWAPNTNLSGISTITLMEVAA